MSRIKWIIIGVLCLACAAVNAPRLIEQFRGEDPVPEEIAPSDTSLPPTTAGLDGGLFGTEAANGSLPTSRPLSRSEDPKPTAPATESKSGAAVLLESMNGLTAKLTESKGVDAANEAPPKRRSPFAYAARGGTSPAADGDERKRGAASVAEEARKREAEEKSRREHTARLDAEESALRKLKIRAIVSSKKGGVARIAGYNLRVGATIPGCRGVIQAIRQDAVDVQLEDRIVRLFLVEPVYDDADGAPAPAALEGKGDPSDTAPPSEATPRRAPESRPAPAAKSVGVAAPISGEAPSSRPAAKVEGGTWTKGE